MRSRAGAVTYTTYSVGYVTATSRYIAGWPGSSDHYLACSGMNTLFLVPPVGTADMRGTHGAAPADTAIVITFEVRTEYYQRRGVVVIVGSAPAFQQFR